MVLCLPPRAVLCSHCPPPGTGAAGLWRAGGLRSLSVGPPPTDPPPPQYCTCSPRHIPVTPRVAPFTCHPLGPSRLGVPPSPVGPLGVPHSQGALRGPIPLVMWVHAMSRSPQAEQGTPDSPPRLRTGGWGLRFPSLPGWSRGPLAPSEHDGAGGHQSAFSLTAPRGYGNIPPVPAPAPLDPPALISPLSGAAPVGAGARPWAGGSFTNVSPAVGLN